MKIVDMIQFTLSQIIEKPYVIIIGLLFIIFDILFMLLVKKSSNGEKIKKSYTFSVVLLNAITLGALIGIIYGKRAMFFKPFGDLFINAMFMIVVPLVLTTISSSISSITDMQRLKKIMGSLFVVFFVTGLIASIIIISVVVVFPPAKGVNLNITEVEAVQPFKTGEQIVKAFTVSDFPELISRKNMLPLILFSIFLGLCVNLIGEKGKIVAKNLDALAEVFMKMINILMYYAPIGLGAYFASLVGEYGPELVGSFARAMAIYYPVCILYFFIAFPIYMYVAGGIDGVKAMKHLIQPAITAIATQSSIATLPVNLEASEKIGIPKDIREIVLPIGATAHMDGTCIGTILKIAFLFGIYKQPFTGIGTFASAILLAVIGGVVMSGVPGGGLIGEMLIVTMYGFPPEAFMIIATIGYLIDPPATMINASGDTVAGMLVTRFVEGPDWMKKNLEEHSI